MDELVNNDDGSTSKSSSLLNLDKPNVLVIGQGDYHCLMPLGICLFLHKRDYLCNIKYYVGSDAGAILTLLLSMGFTPTDVAINLIKFAPLTQDFNPTNIITNHGLLGSDYIIKYLCNIITEKKWARIPTLKQLYENTGNELCLIGYEIGKGKICMNYKTYPDMPCTIAATIAYIRPYIFCKIRYKGLDYMGGLISDPYPIEYYDDGKREILGIFTHNNYKNDGKALSYFSSMITAPIQTLYKHIVGESGGNCSHIEAVSDKIDIIGVPITKNERYEIINKGWKIAQGYYQNLYPGPIHTIQPVEENEDEFV